MNACSYKQSNSYMIARLLGFLLLMVVFLKFYHPLLHVSSHISMHVDEPKATEHAS